MTGKSSGIGAPWVLCRYARIQKRREIIIKVGLWQVIGNAYDLCNAQDAELVYTVRNVVIYMVGSLP